MPTLSVSRFLFFLWSSWGIWAGYNYNHRAELIFSFITIFMSVCMLIYCVWLLHTLSEISVLDLVNKKDKIKEIKKSLEQYSTLSYYVDIFINMLIIILLVVVDYFYTPIILLVLAFVSMFVTSQAKINIDSILKELDRFRKSTCSFS